MLRDCVVYPGLTTLPISQNVMNELERMRKEAIVALINLLSDIFLVVVKKTTENLWR